MYLLRQCLHRSHKRTCRRHFGEEGISNVCDFWLSTWHGASSNWLLDGSVSQKLPDTTSRNRLLHTVAICWDPTKNKAFCAYHPIDRGVREQTIQNAS